MSEFRVSQAAQLLGISDDTVRRYIESGVLPARRDSVNRLVVDGAALAEFSRAQASTAADSTAVQRSARNQLVGLVTSVVTDSVMAQVELQCGPHRVVSLMSTEAVKDLDLEPGCLAVAVIKSTNVIIEVPKPQRSASDRTTGPGPTTQA